MTLRQGHSNLEFVTSYRGCEIHKNIMSGAFFVYEVGESPDDGESAYARCRSEVEAKMVVDSLFSMYQSTAVMDAFLSILPQTKKTN
jgi:hypothetical protein